MFSLNFNVATCRDSVIFKHSKLFFLFVFFVFFNREKKL